MRKDLLSAEQGEALKGYIADLLPLEDCAVLLDVSEIQLRLLLESNVQLAQEVRVIAARGRLEHRRRIRALCETGSQSAEIELANLRLQFERSFNP